ncbi:hypothetical protein FPOAC1_010594 [Fusarium poae]|uniref:hypothetical protein n=1 Tax=Fusarium poae TaxID=36050 RepID=UPI001CE74274|nr:hypothetical protein FPOAC1_010594 [Fusarium poae]KAG8665793.1 hypothetical protein FPOAC1_010594 [Fusarium poae]
MTVSQEAVIAIVGVVVTSLVPIVGLIIKHILDRSRHRPKTNRTSANHIYNHPLLSHRRWFANDFLLGLSMPRTIPRAQIRYLDRDS